MAKYKTRRKLHKRKKPKSKRKLSARQVKKIKHSFKKHKKYIKKHHKKRTRKHGGAAQQKPSPPPIPPPSIPPPPGTPEERNTPVSRTEGFKVPGAAAAAEETTDHKWRVEPKKPWRGYIRPQDIYIDDWLDKPPQAGEHGSLPKQPRSFVERHPKSPIPLDTKGEKDGIYSKEKKSKKATPTPPKVAPPLPPPLSPKEKKN